MKAIILCGGYATRLEPITKFVPKPLLPVGGRPIIDYIIKDLELQGINDIYLSTNEKFASHFEHVVAENTKAKSKVHIIKEPTTHESHKFGAIRGILYAVEKIGLDEDFVVVAGDNFYDFSIAEGLAKFRKTGKPIICLYALETKEHAKRFGVVETLNDKIISFEEKPQNPKSNLISTGIYVFNKGIIPHLKEYIKNDNNPDAPGHFIKWLIENNVEIYCFVVKGSWFDIGTLDTYEQVFEKYRLGAGPKKS
jgi:glucose-1-phosphate thymidylyltransferase